MTTGHQRRFAATELASAEGLSLASRQTTPSSAQDRRSSQVVDEPAADQPWTHIFTTRSGFVLGPAERIPPYVALKAITDWAAYQYFEERSKGTLAAGKLADLVILERDPLSVDPSRLGTITVLETIKEGRPIYRRGIDRIQAAAVSAANRVAADPVLAERLHGTLGWP